MDNRPNAPTPELLRLAEKLRSRARNIIAIAELPPAQFRQATKEVPELTHTPTGRANDENANAQQALRRVTLQRQGTLMHRYADRIDAALAREKSGLGLPSDWEKTMAEATALLK